MRDGRVRQRLECEIALGRCLQGQMAGKGRTLFPGQGKQAQGGHWRAAESSCPSSAILLPSALSGPHVLCIE